LRQFTHCKLFFCSLGGIMRRPIQTCILIILGTVVSPALAQERSAQEKKAIDALTKLGG